MVEVVVSGTTLCGDVGSVDLAVCVSVVALLVIIRRGSLAATSLTLAACPCSGCRPAGLVVVVVAIVGEMVRPDPSTSLSITSLSGPGAVEKCLIVQGIEAEELTEALLSLGNS